MAYPDSPDAVRELLHYAERTGASLIPFGGGTSVVGHVTVLPSATPVVTVDLSRLSDLRLLDSTSHTAVFGAGITGAQLESQLRDRGFTLGHFPQSFEYSTLGGWIATRSRGQQAIHYGGIERLFAGASLETPAGPLNLPAHVASSAGLDLRELVLGSEGRLGIITSATVRISPTPEFERFDGYFFAEYDQAVEAVRMVAQARLPVSMLRLSDPTETAVNLASSTAEQAEATDRFRRERGFGRGSCLLIVGVTGTGVARTTQRHLEQVLAGHGGFAVPGGTHGSDWSHGRFGPRTCAIRCGSWGTRLTRWRPPSTGAGWPPRVPESRTRSGTDSPTSVRSLSPSPTCRTCTRRDRASTPPTCSGWRRNRPRPCDAGRC